MKKFLVLFIALVYSGAVWASEFVLDAPHTHVGFSIKHMMISNVKGEFTKYDADIDFDIPSKSFKALNASVETASIDTGITKRDDHLRSSDFFDAAKFPKLTFAMKRYEAGKMHGDLSIHGITKPIVFDTQIHGVVKDFEGSNRIGFTLTTAINRKDFGLTWNKVLEAGGFAVGEEVTITIEVEAIEM